MTQAKRIAVVGGGWAGIAAACTLLDAGHDVTLFESARQLGGRARRVEWNSGQGSIAVDNGQHILLGAYEATLALMRSLGIDPESVLLRTPINMHSTSGFVLRAPRWPAPLHLAAALLSARGLPWSARWAMICFIQSAKGTNWKLKQDISVSALLTRQRQPEVLIRLVWEPLCVAALNTPASVASAQIFLNVLRDSLGANTRAASDMLVPRVDLGALLPDAAAQKINTQGKLRLGTRVTALLPASEDLRATGITIVLADGSREGYDQTVLAVSAHQVPALTEAFSAANQDFANVARQCAALQWQPIATVYLRYANAPALSAPMLALEENPAHSWYGQWLFDKGALCPEREEMQGVVAVVISADGEHRELDNTALAQAVHQQIAAQTGITQVPADTFVIIEKRATFSCTAELKRPGIKTPFPGLLLAGDYVDSDYPATLESAVRAGINVVNNLANTAQTATSLPLSE